MEYVLILLNMGEEQKTIVFRNGSSIKKLNREKLFEFLVTGTIKNLSDKLFYNSALKAFYQDVYDFIIKHFDEINCIQVYQDNAIRLYSDNILFPKRIVFEDYDFCNDELTSKMLKELITFAKYN